MGILNTNSTSGDQHLNTSQQIKHVFGCSGATMHVTPGFQLLRAGDITRCPQCGSPVTDCTNTLLGQSYLALARFDLGDLP